MTQPSIVSEKPVHIYQVKKDLKAIAKDSEELGFRAQKVKEYIDDISQLTEKKAKESFEEIMKLDIPRFKEEYACKIIDINPVSLDDLKQLISGMSVTIKDDNLKDILKILQK